MEHPHSNDRQEKLLFLSEIYYLYKIKLHPIVYINTKIHFFFFPEKFHFQAYSWSFNLLDLFETMEGILDYKGIDSYVPS